MLGLIVLFGSAAAPARDLAQKKHLARNQFEMAERLRQELNGRPLQDRTRRDYQQVTDAYRRVYYTAPTSSKAEPAVIAVAELLAEAGRRFSDPKSLAGAIGQYEFLRREYPGSKFRVDALYTIAQIYKSDLNDTAAADAAFQDFLKHYPRSAHAEGARAALAELRQPPAKKEKREVVAAEPAAAEPVRTAELREVSSQAAPLRDAATRQEAPAARNGVLPLVTGIRYWSTPDYTRVAIDLETEVQYQAGRVNDPDRIFFDLHNTKLASTLAGKSFEVSDGFLRKIRVAQYTRNITRVVLEVGDLSDYSAFLLPNPYRLIVDIHGRKGGAVQRAARKPEAPAAKPAAKPAVETAVAPPATKPEAAPAKPAASRVETATARVPAPVPVPPPAPARPVTIEERRAQLGGRVNDGTKAPLKPALDEAWANNGAQTTPPVPQVEVASANPATASEPRPRAAATTASTEPAARPAPAAPAPKPATERASAPLPPPGASAKETPPTSAPTYESVAPRTTVAKRTIPVPERTAVPARPTASGERSLTRALGLKVGRIVIDAGHGGHDTGTVGPGGLQEKDLVLDVAQRLGKLLTARLGAEVIYTREDDTFVPLETRPAMANQAEADLFISIHANSSSDPAVRGVETYYLNFTSSRDALEVAARENAVSEKSIHELQDLVKKITLRDKLDESREFATDVQKSLWSGQAFKTPAMRDRGVRQAPFIVLIGANMPSVLAEISFLSNSTDEKRLQSREYRQRIAEYLYRGIAKYANGLSNVKVAQKTRVAAR